MRSHAGERDVFGEAAVNTLVPRDGHVLVLVNGAYGLRMAKLCTMMGRRTSTFVTADDVPTTPADVDRLLAADRSITHVGLIHCETSTGIHNPLAGIADVVARHKRRLLVDAMSSFGALAIDARKVPFDALIAAGQVHRGSARHGLRDREARCVGGVCRQLQLAGARPQRSVGLHGADDAVALHAAAASSWPSMRRSTSSSRRAASPPALRYADNCETLVTGMRTLGFRPFLDSAIQAPIIVTFHAPADPRYDFKVFYASVRERGFILYPGKLTQVETFRVGCMGDRRAGDAPGRARDRRFARGARHSRCRRPRRRSGRVRDESVA